MFVEQQFCKFCSQNGCNWPKEVHINLPQWLRLAKSQQCWLKHHQVHKEWVHQPTFTAEWEKIYKCKALWQLVKQNMYINQSWDGFTYFNLLIIRKRNRGILSFISTLPIGLTHSNWRQLVANKTCFHFWKTILLLQHKYYVYPVLKTGLQKSYLLRTKFCCRVLFSFRDRRPFVMADKNKCENVAIIFPWVFILLETAKKVWSYNPRQILHNLGNLDTSFHHLFRQNITWCFVNALSSLYSCV